MIYKETGQYKSSYKSDHAIFPLLQDKIAFSTLMFIAFLIIPFVINSYWEKAILVPFLIFSLAAIGLNILTGYCGQVSLGTGGFMAVGAYASYKLMTAFPDLNIFFVIILSGFVTAFVGTLFGLPSLRIKGFYLAVATLAAQFFLIWLFNKVGWFYNYSATGMITAPSRSVGSFFITGSESTPAAKYLFCFLFVWCWIFFCSSASCCLDFKCRRDNPCQTIHAYGVMVIATICNFNSTIIFQCRSHPNFSWTSE